MKNLSTKSLLFSLACFIYSLQVQAQPQDFNITLLGHLPYNKELNDIWGYTDGTGVEYALVGTQTGTSVVSLANPSSPVELLFIPGATSVWRDLKTWGNFAYVTCDQGNDGLLIIDLSPLPSGTPTYQYWRPELNINGDIDTLNKAHNLYIDENGYCYIAGSNINAGETFILDVHTTPGTPIIQGATMAFYAHDAYARGDTLWTSDINNGTFSAYDVSNKMSPAIIGNQATPRDFCHNAWISDDGQTLFTTDEKSNAWVASFDVSDLGNIQELDRWRTPNENTIPHNTHTYDDFQVISYYTDGVVILDASRPDNLIEVARYDTYTSNPSTGFYGAWGAYPYSPTGLLYVSDINNGLFVFQPNYQRACWLEGIVTDQSTSMPIFDVDVKILTTYSDDETDLSGEYKTGMGMAGTYDVEFKKVGYIPQIISVTLSNGIVTTQNVQLVPATPFTITGQVVDSTNPSNGIANAVIHMQSSLYEYNATADASGNFSLQIYPDNDYTVYAGNWGNHTKAFSLNALDSTTIPTQIYPLVEGYKDEYVLDLGWTESGTTLTGNWERAIPENIFTWQGALLPDGDLKNDLGDYCLVTGNNGNGQNGADDIDDGFTQISSPAMDLTNATNPILTFHYVFNKPWPANAEDSFDVSISNGLTTVTVLSTLIPEYAWSNTISIRILDHISLTNNMQVHFKMNDSSPGNIVEGLIDLFEIQDTLSTSVQVIPATAIEMTYFPNPFSNSLHVDYNIEDNFDHVSLKVFNALGQLVEEQTIQQATGSLELGSNWTNGVYFIALGSKTIKVIKNE